MKDNEKDYMERYIYQVVRRLPKNQRDDVRMELEELIDDMYTEKGSMDMVLAELGDPAVFARQYQTGLHHLIGPDYYDTYKITLKVLLILTAALTLGLSIVSLFIKTPVESVTGGYIIRTGAEGISSGIETAISACLSVFGVVTLLFAVFERQHVKVEEKQRRQWSVDDLKKSHKKAEAAWTPALLEPVPDPKALISRGECVAGIVVLGILSVLLIFAPDLFAATVTDGDELIATVPIFNLEKWAGIWPLIALSMLVALADEVVRMVYGRYGRQVMVSGIVSSAITLVLDFIVLKVMPLWNPHFQQDMESALMKTSASAEEASFFSLFNAGTVSNILLAVILVITAIDLAVTIGRSVKYGAKR